MLIHCTVMHSTEAGRSGSFENHRMRSDGGSKQETTLGMNWESQRWIPNEWLVPSLN